MCICITPNRTHAILLNSLTHQKFNDYYKEINKKGLDYESSNTFFWQFSKIRVFLVCA